MTNKNARLNRNGKCRERKYFFHKKKQIPRIKNGKKWKKTQGNRKRIRRSIVRPWYMIGTNCTKTHLALKICKLRRLLRFARSRPMNRFVRLINLCRRKVSLAKKRIPLLDTPTRIIFLSLVQNLMRTGNTHVPLMNRMIPRKNIVQMSILVVLIMSTGTFLNALARIFLRRSYWKTTPKTRLAKLTKALLFVTPRELLSVPKRKRKRVVIVQRTPRARHRNTITTMVTILYWKLIRLFSLKSNRRKKRSLSRRAFPLRKHTSIVTIALVRTTFLSRALVPRRMVTILDPLRRQLTRGWKELIPRQK